METFDLHVIYDRWNDRTCKEKKKKMRICNNTVVFYEENAILSCLLMINKRGKSIKSFQYKLIKSYCDVDALRIL